jgi:hypothetical protein
VTQSLTVVKDMRRQLSHRSCRLIRDWRMAASVSFFDKRSATVSQRRALELKADFGSLGIWCDVYPRHAGREYRIFREFLMQYEK